MTSKLNGDLTDYNFRN